MLSRLKVDTGGEDHQAQLLLMSYYRGIDSSADVDVGAKAARRARASAATASSIESTAVHRDSECRGPHEDVAMSGTAVGSVDS